MAKHSRHGTLAGICALAIACFQASSAQAKSTVVRTTGPSSSALPVGKSLAEGERIVLQAGDMITVLDSSGTRVLKGPGRFTIGGRSDAKRDVLKTFITRNVGRQRARIGAVRGDVGQDGSVPAPTIWLLDQGDAGRFCHVEGARLLFWRQGNAGPATITLTAAEGGDPVEVTWEDGSRISAWPQEQAPIHTGASYRLQFEGAESAVEVGFVLLDQEPGDLDTLVAALATNGCASQIDRLIAAGGEEAAEQDPD